MSKIVALISPTNQTTKDSRKPDGTWDGARDGKVNGMGLCIGKDEIKGMWEGLVVEEGNDSWGMGAALSYPMVRVTVTTFMVYIIPPLVTFSRLDPRHWIAMIREGQTWIGGQHLILDTTIVTIVAGRSLGQQHSAHSGNGVLNPLQQKVICIRSKITTVGKIGNMCNFGLTIQGQPHLIIGS